MKLALVFLVILSYWLSRLLNLTNIPVFADEAIYIRWSQIIQTVETLRFIPLTDGKQPLFMWLTVPFLKFFSDPLFAGRMVSVIAGFFSLIAVFWATTISANFRYKTDNMIEFFKSSYRRFFYLGIFSSFVYLCLPFSYFFDRIAVADNLLSLFGLLILCITVLLIKFPRLDLSIILGGVMGMAWLTKSPAIYFVFLSTLTLVIFYIKKIKMLVLPMISLIITFAIYNLLRLGPQFHMISLRNRDYVWSINEILKHPFDPLIPHLFDIFRIYSHYLSLPLLVIAFIGFLLVLVKPSHKNNVNPIPFVITIWWILPLLATATLAKVFTARYILFTLPPLVILISIGIRHFFYHTGSLFTHRLFQYIFILITFSLNIWWIIRLNLMPNKLILPSTEIGYIWGWTSGWGIKPAFNYLSSRVEQGYNVIVGTEGYFGTLPDGLQIYSQGKPRFTVIGVGLGFKQIPENLVDARNHNDDVYLLINRSRLEIMPDEYKKINLVESYPKPDGDSLLLYRL